jgi:hypothetical protein
MSWSHISVNSWTTYIVHGFPSIPGRVVGFLSTTRIFGMDMKLILSEGVYTEVMVSGTELKHCPSMQCPR